MLSRYFTPSDISLSLFTISLLVYKIYYDIQQDKLFPKTGSNVDLSNNNINNNNKNTKQSKKPKKHKRKGDLDGDDVDFTSFDVDKWVRSMTELPTGSARERAERDAALVSREDVYECVIVGGGISGLQCARLLVDTYKIPIDRILILEAQDRVGGRVRQDPKLGCDVGAVAFTKNDTRVHELAMQHEVALLEHLSVTHNSTVNYTPTNCGNRYALHYSFNSHTRNDGSVQEADQIVRHDQATNPIGNNKLISIFKCRDTLRVLVDALKQDLPIKLNSPVIDIDYTRGWANEHFTGIPRKPVLVTTSHQVRYKTRCVVVAVPPAVLKDSKSLAIAPQFAPARIDSLHKITMLNTIRITLQFRQRPWPMELERIIVSGTNVFTPEIWFSNAEETGMSTYLACAIAVGTKADTLSTMDGEAVCQLLLNQLAKILDRCGTENQQVLPSAITSYTGGAVQYWSAADMPFIGGGFCVVPPDAERDPTKLTNAVSKPLGAGNSGRIFFCGDYTSPLAQATPRGCSMEAALQSGQRVADEVAQFLASDE